MMDALVAMARASVSGFSSDPRWHVRGRHPRFRHRRLRQRGVRRSQEPPDQRPDSTSPADSRPRSISPWLRNRRRDLQDPRLRRCAGGCGPQTPRRGTARARDQKRDRRHHGGVRLEIREKGTEDRSRRERSDVRGARMRPVGPLGEGSLAGRFRKRRSYEPRQPCDGCVPSTTIKRRIADGYSTVVPGSGSSTSPTVPPKQTLQKLMLLQMLLELMRSRESRIPPEREKPDAERRRRMIRRSSHLCSESRPASPN